jgi:hypothetical protein
MNDDDRAGLDRHPSGIGNTVLEGGLSTRSTSLARPPDSDVTVHLDALDDQLTLPTSLTFTIGELEHAADHYAHGLG